MRLSFTGGEVGWTTKTSVPRTFSFTCTKTSPSEKREISASLTGRERYWAISSASGRFALPEKSFRSYLIAGLARSWLGREDSNLRIRDPKARALPRGHASSLPCAKQLGQLSGPRAVRIHRRRDATIRLGRAGAERRVHQHERQRAGDDRFEHFATARPERGTTAQEERHVHSERGGHFGEPGRRPPEAPQTVEAEEHGGGITRS